MRRFDPAKAIWPLRRSWLIVFVGMTFSLSTVHVWSTLYSFVFFLFGSGMWFLTSPPEQPGQGPGQGVAVDDPDPVPQGRTAARYSRFPVRSRVPEPAATRSRST
jgi:hypothetical protein